MRIGVDLRYTSQSHMGTGTYAETIALALADTLEKDDTLIGFSDAQDLPKRLAEQMEHIRIAGAFTGKNNLLSNRLLWDSRISEQNLDVFFSPCGMAPGIKTCPVVITIHDLLFEHNPEYFSESLLAYLKNEIPRSIGQSDLIIAISEFTKKDILSTYPISPERVQVIHQGIRDLFKAKPDKTKIQKILKTLEIKQPYMLTLSNHAPHKNTAHVVATFAGWLRESQDTRYSLVIAGGGMAPQMPVPLEKIVKENGIENRVKIIGRVEDAHLPALYAGAKTFLYPSLYEGWGLPPLEAIAMGTPVIASDRGALPEAIDDSGIILSPDNIGPWIETIEKVISKGISKELRQAMKARRKAFFNPVGTTLRKAFEDAIQHWKENSAIKSVFVQNEKPPTGISGCTIVRDAVRLDYPLEESIASYAPICDEIIICWDPTSTDATKQLVEKIAAQFPQVRLVESVWDLEKRKGGLELSRQALIALAHCTQPWSLYIEADEALHERYHEDLRAYVRDPNLAGLAFERRSFLHSLDKEIPEYRVGIVRMFRSGCGRLTGDTISFQVEGHDGQTIPTQALLFNYSRLGTDEENADRLGNLDRFYNSDESLATLDPNRGNALATIPYSDTHPAPIEKRFRKPTDISSSPSKKTAPTLSGLSILIPSYNDLPYLKLLIKSIREHSTYDHEIVVVSDGSSDGTKKYCEADKNIIFKHLETNQGICTTTNLAVSMASSEWLFLMNSDMVVGPGWDVELIKHLGPNRVVSATCIEPGLVEVASIFHTLNCGVNADSFDWAQFRQASRTLYEDVIEPGVQYPFCISKELWNRVGGLDPAFNPGPFNDPDLFYRLALEGVEFIRSRSSLIYHFSGVTFRRRDPEYWQEAENQNFQIFLNKWGEEPKYTFGSTVTPGPNATARYHKMTPQQIRTQPKRTTTPRIAVHIIAQEVDEFGTLLFSSCLESLNDYADQIVIVDNGLCDAAKDIVISLRQRLPITFVDGRQTVRFDHLRNLAIQATDAGMTHIHKIDTDEVYFPNSLPAIKDMLHNPEIGSISGGLVHFMIEPNLMQSLQHKEVIFRFDKELSWHGGVHEEITGLKPGESITAPFSFLHFGYCRPQWQIFLKWLKYAMLQFDHLDHYKHEIIDGVRLPWFRDGISPDTILETRRPHLQPYEGQYPLSTKIWLENYSGSGLDWQTWVSNKVDQSLWETWQDLYAKEGCWERTLETILTHSFNSNMTSSPTTQSVQVIQPEKPANLPEEESPQKPSISIITCLKNRFANFREMLKAVANANDSHLIELIVVDYDSDDGDIAEILSHTPLKSKLIRVEPPFRRSQGLNIGFEHSSGDIVYFCDADVLIPPDMINRILHTVRPGVSYFPICRDLTEIVDSLEPLAQELAKPGALGDWCIFGYGLCAFTRADFIRIGKWNERFNRHGYADNDLHYRQHLMGLRTIRETVDGYYHLYHPRTQEFANRYYLESELGKIEERLDSLQKPSGTDSPEAV